MAYSRIWQFISGTFVGAGAVVRQLPASAQDYIKSFVILKISPLHLLTTMRLEFGPLAYGSTR